MHPEVGVYSQIKYWDDDPFFPFLMTQADPGLGPHTTGAIPSSCRARSAPRCELSAYAQLHFQPGCHPVQAGEPG